MTNSGKRRTLVTIEQPVEATATDGQVTITWTELGNEWVRVHTLTAREAEHAKQLVARATVEVTALYRSDVTTRMRINIDNSRYLYIESIIPDDRNREMTLLCSEDV